ncbi:MAG: tyrosine--tRNA ligase [Acidobacteria bacterium]|nr:tyrosine--tRNA ligase [Acidobacteriota bacterium]
MTHPIDLLRERGFIQDITDEPALRELLESEPVTFYVGFDPTASSLHIGNLVGLMAMAWLQRAGHRPIAVAGGGTGRIGDPSGRDDERELLDESAIAANLQCLKDQLGRVIDVTDPERGMVVDNHDWLGQLGFIEVLRDVGKHFSVNQMISREAVRRRLEEREQGISYTEFSYQLLQAYDFAHLYDTYGCRLQGGGSDQWGNVTAGIDLTRRLHGAEVFGISWPLLERSDGKKFSKSTGEAVWLAADETSPYVYYQWFFNIPDNDAERFLKIFTFLPLEEIEQLAAESRREPSGRAAQRALAREATRIMHGDDGLAAAERPSAILFGDEPFFELDDETLMDAFESAPAVALPRADLEAEMGLLEFMVKVGAAKSNGEARRLVDQGGVMLNNARVDDPARRIGVDDLASETILVLRIGKKRYFIVKFA